MKKITALLALASAAALTLSSCGAPQGSSNSSGGSSGGLMNNMWIMLLLYAAIFAAIYFFIIRPNSKRKKQEKAMRDNLEIGDEITTIGGIVGRVVSIKEDTDSFILETGADRTKIQLKRWAISTVDTMKDEPAAQKSAETKSKGFFGKNKNSEEEK